MATRLTAAALLTAATRISTALRLCAGCALLAACAGPADSADGEATATTVGLDADRPTWDFGSPSPQAQHALFLINRARSDPDAEGERLVRTSDPDSLRAIDTFGVDTATVLSDFGGYAASPPLAFNAKLAEAAAVHATDQAAHRTQTHLGSDGTKPRDRILATGLRARATGENLASYVTSATNAHESFQIDWGGPPPSGVQNWPDPKHRRNIMATSSTARRFDSVGIAFVTAADVPALPDALQPGEGDPAYGPLVEVQEFAETGMRFAVGTVFSDTNENAAFDPGEGISGVEVVPVDSDYRALTASDGGYAVPIDSKPTTVEVRFTGEGWTDTRSAPSPTDDSVLIDLVR